MFKNIESISKHYQFITDSIVNPEIVISYVTKSQTQEVNLITKALPSANGTANTDGKSSLREVTVVKRRSSATEVARRVDGFV